LRPFSGTDDEYQAIAKGTVFHDIDAVTRSEAKYALGRQMLQRLTGEYYTCDLNLGLLGLPMAPGDVVRLTAAGLDGQKSFLITELTGSGGEVMAHGYHYPQALALSNTFLDTGIEGTWRWAAEDGTLNDSNSAPDGSDPDPVTCTLADTATRHWQGPVHQNGYAEWDDPLIDAAKHDVIEVCTMLLPEIDGNVRAANWSPGGWGDNEYMPVFAWAKTGTDEAMIVGFYREGFDAGTESIVTHRLFIGWTSDYTGATTGGVITFTAYAQSANGIAGRSASVQPSAETACALSLAWQPDGTAKLYADRQMVCSGTGFDKDDWSSLHVMTQTDIRIGCVRHLQTDTEITELQRLQGANGLDTYEP
jgi:hypothetical protein